MSVLRVDAARNADRIVEAAGAAFEQAGPDVTLEEIARRAGVGVATLYRRFGGRDGLVRAVVGALFRTRIEPATLIDSGDAWADLATVLGTAVETFAAHRVAAGLSRGLWDDDARRAYVDALDRPLQRAIAAGAVRPELRARDAVAVIPMVLAADRDGEADRRRYLALLLDGMRPGRPPLPG